MPFAIRQNVSLAALNTLAVPATAEYFCEVHDASEVEEALRFASEHRLQVQVLGGGSNVVLGDKLSGLWIHQCSPGRNCTETDDGQLQLTLGGGENWHDSVRWSLQQGASGLENLALIPGTAGAAPIQNIGAYGVELEEFFTSLDAIDLASGEWRSFTAAECAFSYRDSVFKNELRDRFLIQSVSLHLPREATPRISYPALAQQLENVGTSAPTALQVFDAVVAIRSSKLPDPAVLPNAGSFFKNPLVPDPELQRLRVDHPEMPAYPQPDGSQKLAAGWLIEQCGFRGGPQSGVRMHRDHALVLVNPEHRSGAEIQAFAVQVRDAVQLRFGVCLEQEPRSYAC